MGLDMEQVNWHDEYYHSDGCLYHKHNRSQKRKKDHKAAKIGSNGYKYVTHKGMNWQEHRIIFYMVNGYVPKTLDHIDRDKLNNHPDNLREVTVKQNAQNRTSRKGSTSRHKGVSFKNNRWYAAIHRDGIDYYLGCYKNEHVAAEAYNVKAREFVDCYNLNDIPSFVLMKYEEEIDAIPAKIAKIESQRPALQAKLKATKEKYK